jgi:hypothetical protein
MSRKAQMAPVVAKPASVQETNPVSITWPDQSCRMPIPPTPQNPSSIAHRTIRASRVEDSSSVVPQPVALRSVNPSTRTLSMAPGEPGSPQMTPWVQPVEPEAIPCRTPTNRPEGSANAISPRQSSEAGSKYRSGSIGRPSLRRSGEPAAISGSSA